MKRISASEFKARCLSLLDRVEPEGIVITKHGRPVARLVPAQMEYAELIGSLKGRIKIKGNVLSTGLRWDAQSRHPRPAPRARR